MKTDKFVLLVDITVTLVHQEMNVLFVLETESIHQPVLVQMVTMMQD
jgi:hypothetical protein